MNDYAPAAPPSPPPAPVLGYETPVVHPRPAVLHLVVWFAVGWVAALVTVCLAIVWVYPGGGTGHAKAFATLVGQYTFSAAVIGTATFAAAAVLRKFLSRRPRRSRGRFAAVLARAGFGACLCLLFAVAEFFDRHGNWVWVAALATATLIAAPAAILVLTPPASPP